MFTRHKFDPPTGDDMAMDNTSYIDNGKVLSTYAVECENDEQTRAVGDYYGVNMGRMEGYNKICVGVWIFEGEPKRIRTTKKSLLGNDNFMKSGTPILSFDEFEILKDQKEFDVLDFISSLG